MLPHNSGKRYTQKMFASALVEDEISKYYTRLRLIVSEVFWEPRHAADSDGDDDGDLIL